MTNPNPESNETEFKYTGDADAFHASLATIAEDAPVEDMTEEENDAVVDEPAKEEPAAEEPEEEEEDEEEPEGEALPKELVQRILDDPALQKVLKNRTIRETKEELKAARDETRSERDARIIAEREASAYKKAMDEYFKGKQPEAEEVESEWIDPEAEKAFKEIKGELAQRKEQEAIQTGRQALYAEAGAHAQTFTKDNNVTDYPDAVNHLMNVKARELKAMGVPEKELGAKVNQWVDLIAYTALEQGKNIAEYGYNLAKDMGYQQKAKAAPVKKTGPNLDAIRENAKKTAPERPGSDVGLGDGDHKTLPKNKHGEVDPAEFAKILAKYQ